MASNIDEWLPETRKPDILKLVYVFFFMGILVATLDIVVDGWSLTMLKRLVLLLTFLLLRIGTLCYYIIPMLHVKIYTGITWAMRLLAIQPVW